MKDLYLVTGAAGHLGLTVVEELRKEGKTVRALVLPGDKAAGKLPEGVEMVMPGDNIDMEITLITPIALEQGLRFAIREGGRTVGSGVVAKVIE